MIRTDIASYLKPSNIANHKLAIVAGAASDNAAVTGNVVDRINFESGILQVTYSATLAEGKTSSLKIEVLESSDNSNWDAAVTLFDGVLATGGAGGTTSTDIKEIALNLANYKRYIKFKTTMDLDATATDTAFYYSALNLGGSTYLPF